MFTDYTVARLTGNFSILSIKGLLPVAQVSATMGTVTGPIPSTHVAVSHFAARYIALRHIDAGASDTGMCFAASLALNVAIPGRHQREALLLREHERRDGSGVFGLRQHSLTHGALEHVQGERRRLRVAAEPEHRRHRKRQGVRRSPAR